jgi:predicted DNA binding CopG/RHH family protein
MKANVPHIKSDRQAEEFLDLDLSELDFSAFKPIRFELRNKDARINMRLPQGLLDTLKARAKEQQVPYQRYIRDLLEAGLARG